MNDDKYRALLAAGAYEAKLFALNIALFVDMIILNLNDIQEWRVEGSDFLVDTICWKTSNLDPETISVLGKIGGTGCIVPQIVHGGIEVKAISPGKFIQRNDIGYCPDNAVPLAMWDGNTEDHNGNIVYTRKKHGSMRRWFQPEWAPLSSEPLILAYMLECFDAQGHVRPYASIVFSDFKEFKSRLIEYARDSGLDLEDYDRIPVGKAAHNYTCGNLVFRHNMWYVPLHLLVDIARITIIGDAPQFYQNRNCTVEMQKRRYQYLCDHAASFIPYESLKFEGKIIAETPDHPVFSLLKKGTSALSGKLLDANGQGIKYI